MIYDYHILFGIASAVLGTVGFFPYIRDILRGTTKPHPFSWFIWGVVSGIGFLAQLAGGGETGAWITGVGSVGCFIITALALRQGEPTIVALDWWCLGGAIAALVLWRITNNPLSATILVTLTDFLATIPTLRKSYLRPHEETVATYAMGFVGFSLGLLALRSFNLTTALFPAYVVIMNGCLVLTLLIRRNR